MKRVASLLLGVTLLFASCGKDTPEPAAPELLGRWNSQKSADFNYDATGQLLSQGQVTDQSFYLEIQPDSLHYRNIRDGSSLGSYKYTRQGNTLQYGNSIQALIVTLDAQHLTLRYPDPYKRAGFPYQEVEDYYVR